MKCIKKKISLLLTCCCLSQPVNADVNSDLNDFFNKLGGGSNVTQAGAWQGQSAGYLTGGALFVRVPVRNIQLISVTLPDVKAGCGGIDAYLGAFSFINSDQIKAMAKQILSNALGYAFDLALETTMPQVKSVKDYLQRLAQDMNSLNVSTCQAAQGIVGGLAPKTQATSEFICQSIAQNHSVFADWAASRQGCGAGGETDKVFNKASPEEQKRIPRNKNLTWSSFDKIGQFISNDRELKELMMTVVGTVIYDNKGNLTIIPSLGANDSLINALLYGGETEIYRCDDTSQCLKPKKSDLTITANKAMVEQVRVTLKSIFNKVKKDQPLDAKEKSFIQSTRIKILRYIIDTASLNMDESFVTNLSEYIALDITLAYIDGLIDTVEMAGAGSLNSEEENKQFQGNLASVREKLGQRLSKIQIKQNAFLDADNQLMMLRKQLSNSVSSQMRQNYSWE
ncbi:conjugal transfer protein TraH [Morganella morganii subsp. morganii]|uniref:conjugal transfer protein TraH n=1 Tax=Morganella morganii TaxID=582 RepID=UPI001BDB6A22|nr:conjugal transfer protein TraH [Morganella morganii]MBT0513753.1 conjugal transfer protein TraH [Morganella morganii subsp. morganii]UNJ80394.1 IncF plasmid conjugative transfer pilus assembly protein TraH [Morganella morganii]